MKASLTPRLAQRSLQKRCSAALLHQRYTFASILCTCALLGCVEERFESSLASLAPETQGNAGNPSTEPNTPATDTAGPEIDGPGLPPGPAPSTSGDAGSPPVGAEADASTGDVPSSPAPASGTDVGAEGPATMDSTEDVDPTDPTENEDPPEEPNPSATDAAATTQTDSEPSNADAGVEERPEPECSDEAVLGPEGHCYVFEDEEHTWQSARRACKDLGDGWDLAAINSEGEHEWVTSVLEDEVWLAGRNVDGVWTWVNDETRFWRGGPLGNAVGGSFTQWEPTEPSGSLSSNQCLQYSDDTGDWRWADLPCGREYGYLCERAPTD